MRWASLAASLECADEGADGRVAAVAESLVTLEGLVGPSYLPLA